MGRVKREPSDPFNFFGRSCEDGEETNVGCASGTNVVNGDVKDVGRIVKAESGTTNGAKRKGRTHRDERSAVEDVTAASAHASHQDAKPLRAKKPRVAPEKVKEVYDKFIVELAKNYGFGMKEVPLDTLVMAVGYKNVRSDAILASLKALVNDDVAEKTAKSCRFTAHGIELYAPKETHAESPDQALAQFWTQFEMKLASKSKSSGDKVAVASKAVWDKLKDGKAHHKDDLVALTTYGMSRSTGFGEILMALRQLGFTEAGPNGGTIVFTDKVFPFGRP